MLDSIINLFASYGLFGLIIYVGLVFGGLFWLGIEWKGNGVFESKLFRWIYRFMSGIGCFIALFILDEIGITNPTLISILAVGVSLLWAAGEVAVGCLGFSALALLVSAVIIVEGIIGIEEGALFYILSFILWLVLMGVAVEGLTGLKSIVINNAKSEYEQALSYLRSGDFGKCSECLNRALHFLVDDYSSYFSSYLDEDLEDKIKQLKYNLESIQDADNYYNSENYSRASELYKEIMDKIPDLKEILKEKYEKAMSKAFLEEIRKADELFYENNIESALLEYELLLEKYPMFEDELIQKIDRCRAELSIRRLKSECKYLLQKADELFENNKIEEALEEYEKLLKKCPMFKDEIISKIDKCKEALGRR
jgi:tetratricopeptide (TPR) repeat protein